MLCTSLIRAPPAVAAARRRARTHKNNPHLGDRLVQAGLQQRLLVRLLLLGELLHDLGRKLLGLALFCGRSIALQDAQRLAARRRVSAARGAIVAQACMQSAAVAEPAAGQQARRLRGEVGARRCCVAESGVGGKCASHGARMRVASTSSEGWKDNDAENAAAFL